MGRLIVLAAAFLVFFSGSLQSLAFGTIAGLGQNREHERITRNALSCAQAPGANCFQPGSIDELAGKSGTFGAVGAPDNPIRGLLSSSAAHCDNGDHLPIPGYVQSAVAAQMVLQTCRDWMETHMQAAVTAASRLILPDGTIDDSQIPTIVTCTFTGGSGRAKCDVLEAFGLVLHASEDFYSHTNWVDLPDLSLPVGTTTNPPGLGQGFPAPWLDLRNPSPPFPPGLISGCFDKIPEQFFCNDGPGRTKHHDINKDKGTIDPSITGPNTPRGQVAGNFHRAVSVAIADTRDKWRILQERLNSTYGGPRASLMICALTHDDPASTCGAPGQRKWSPFDIFNSLTITIGSLAALGGGGFYLAGRRRRDRGGAEQPA